MSDMRMGEELPTVDGTALEAIDDLNANGASTSTLTVEAAGDTVRSPRERRRGFEPAAVGPSTPTASPACGHP